MKVSQQSVGRFKKRIELTGTGAANNRRNCKGVRKSSERQDRYLKNLILENRKTSARNLKLKCGESGVNVSLKTVRRRAKELGFRTCRPLSKPKLTPLMRKKRLL